MNIQNLFLLLVLGITACLLSAKAEAQAGYFEDNTDDFIDFDADDEEFENVPRSSPVKASKESVSEDIKMQEGVPEAVEQNVPIVDTTDDDDEATVESEDEFSHLNDEEEFIGFSSDSSSSSSRGQPKKDSPKEPKITIADVPLHLRSNWDSFYLELLLFAALLIYFTNFSIGRTKNLKLATAWFDSHKSLLMHHFALVGDDGKATASEGNSTSEAKSVISTAGGCAGLQKENENLYSLYCSGRVCVHSMLVELKFIKRQDLASLVANIFRPSNDEVVIKLRLDDMDSFVMCLAAKKVASKYTKDMNDITTYCPGERRSLSSKHFTSSLASKFVVLSEIGEASQAVLGDQVTATMLNKFLGQLNYLHISDQYAGPKQPEQEQQMAPEKTSDVQKMPEVHKMIILSLQMMPAKDKAMSSVEAVENLRPMMLMMLHLADKIYRLRLGKDAKLKAKKNRSKVEEAFHKATHAARAERAQGIREEKKREAREKMMEIDDPEKQRKWEEKENKKAAKRRNPKMKPIKVAK